MLFRRRLYNSILKLNSGSTEMIIFCLPKIKQESDLKGSQLSAENEKYSIFMSLL